MRIRTIPLLAGLALVASHGAAQHCWPSMITVVVRDAGGAVIDPAPLMDSLRFSPAPGKTADFMTRRALVDPHDTNRFDQPGGTPVIAWYGQGDCRVDMREVVLRARGKVMRLWMDLHVDTRAHPGRSSYLLEAPPLADGTWRLDVCRLPSAKTDGYALIPGRWVRVSDSGEPGSPPQGPQGCGGAGAAR